MSGGTMSSSTTPQGEPEYLELGRTPRSGPRRGLVVGIVAGVVLAVGVPLGAFAVLRFLGGGGTQPEDVLPADAIGYARVDLDPSGAQKIAALRFLGSFPAFEKYTHISDDRTDLREEIVDDALKAESCDLTFADDVEPWLGERFGIAVLAPAAGADEPEVVGAVQVTDEDAARQGLDALRACDDGTASAGGWSYLDGYMLVAQTQRRADAAADSARRSPLADSPRFTTDMERLGEPGFASGWFSGEDVYDVVSSQMVGDPGPAGGELDLMRDRARRQVQQSYRSGAFALRFDGSYVELASVLSGDGYAEPSRPAVADMALPETTAVAVGVAGGAEYVDQQWDMLRGLATGDDPSALMPLGSGDPADDQRQLEQALGLRLPDDLETLLGDSFTLALDGAGLGDVVRSGDPRRLDLGLRASTDPEGFADVLDRVQAAAARQGLPLDLVVERGDDRSVAALDDGYAADLVQDGPLADTQAFRLAVPDIDEVRAVAYVNVDMLEQPITEALQQTGMVGHEFLANLAQVQSLGLAGCPHDGYSESTFRITVGG